MVGSNFLGPVNIHLRPIKNPKGYGSMGGNVTLKRPIRYYPLSHWASGKPPLHGHVFTLPLLAHGFGGRPDANGADEFHALRLQPTAGTGSFNRVA